MDIRNYLAAENELPLDKIVDDGGFACIFRSIACIGDSLSSGEFETKDPDETKHYHDLFEYSWGQFMARTLGSKVYNFSKGGMTAKTYMESFAEQNQYFDPKKACQAYIIAMGCNDITRAIRENTDLGSMADVKESWQDNADSFAGHYAAIIQRYRLIQPDAKFFLMTMPHSYGMPEEKIALQDRHRELLYEMADHFPNTYVMDFRKYAPVYDQEFKQNFYLHGHLNPCGYVLTAKMVISYLDYIIRHHMADFREAGLIGTSFVNAIRHGE